MSLQGGDLNVAIQVEKPLVAISPHSSQISAAYHSQRSKTKRRNQSRIFCLAMQNGWLGVIEILESEHYWEWQTYWGLPKLDGLSVLTNEAESIIGEALLSKKICLFSLFKTPIQDILVIALSSFCSVCSQQFSNYVIPSLTHKHNFSACRG